MRTADGIRSARLPQITSWRSSFWLASYSPPDPSRTPSCVFFHSRILMVRSARASTTARGLGRGTIALGHPRNDELVLDPYPRSVLIQDRHRMRPRSPVDRGILLFLVQYLIIMPWSVAGRQSISRGLCGPGSRPARGTPRF